MVADMSLKQLQGSGLCGHCTWKEHGGHWDRESSSLSIGESELYLGITVNMNLLVMPGDIGNILNILSFQVSQNHCTYMLVTVYWFVVQNCPWRVQRYVEHFASFFIELNVMRRFNLEFPSWLAPRAQPHCFSSLVLHSLELFVLIEYFFEVRVCLIDLCVSIGGCHIAGTQ